MQGRVNSIPEETKKILIPSRFLTIRKKLIFYFAISALFSSLLLGILIIWQTSQAFSARTEALFSSSAAHKVHQLFLWLEDNKNNVSAFTDISGVFAAKADEFMQEPDTIKKDALLVTMEQFLFHNPTFRQLFLMDPVTGKILVSTAPIEEGADVSDRAYFKKGLKGLYATPIYRRVLMPDEHAITVTIPVLNDTRKLLAVFGAHINLFALNDILSERSGLGGTGETYVISRDYSIIAGVGFTEQHGMPMNELQDKTIRTPGVLNALAGQNGYATYMGYNNYEVAGYYTYLPFFDAALLVEQHTHETLGPIHALEITIGLYILAVLVLVLFMANVVAATFSRPLVHLAGDARRIASGELKHRIRITTSDEIGTLATAFSQMTNHLVNSLNETGNIIETMPDALFILNRDGKMRFVNHAASLLIGTDKGRLVGQPFGPLILRQDAPWAHVLKNLKTDPQTSCYIKSGVKIPVGFSSSALKGEKNSVAGFLVVLKDLRELKKYAKRRLDEITPLLQSISLGDFTKRPELPPLEDEFTDLLVAVDLMSENLRALIEESQKKTNEIEFSKDKLEVAHHGLKKALTAIEKEKAKADTLLASLGEGVMAIDLRGNLMILNREAEGMFEHSSSEVLGKPFMKFFKFMNEKGEIVTLKEYPLSEAIAQKKTVFSTTYLTRKDAEPLPLATTASPILFEGKLFGIIGTFRDITKEQEIDKAKTEFVSLASHQLRTPLTAIKWLLQELLRKGGLTKTQHEYAQDALKSNERMVNLVNDLLNVSRLEAGKISVFSEKTDITDAISQIIGEVGTESREKHLKINFIRPASPISIEVDGQLFRQIVTNLLSNAIKYSNPKTTVTLRLAKKAGKVQIEVEDQGIGIPKDQQYRIFEKFFRTDEAAKYSTTGSGLGLYIAKKIMHACHGSIRFVSLENKGTTFIVTFPQKGPVLKKGEQQLIPHKIS